MLAASSRQSGARARGASRGASWPGSAGRGQGAWFPCPRGGGRRRHLAAV